MSAWPSCCRWSATPPGMPTATSSNHPAAEPDPANAKGNAVMEETVRWIGGGLVSLIGIVGLFLAANALDRGIYIFGLALAVFAVTYAFALIRHAFDERDARITTTPAARSI